MREELHDGPDDDDDVVELGEVSADTHGGAFGHSFDGGFSWRFP